MPMLVFVLIACTVFHPVDTFAGVTGKIRGLVTDAKGEPLRDVNIVVEGTRQGATTDENGFYILLALEPGTYTIAASLIGYQSRSTSEVRISADHTSIVDFVLEETSLEVSEVIVTANRRVIDVDQTASKYSVTAQDLREVPMIRDISALLALQPGLEATGTGIVRGGNNAPWSRDITYYIDGVRLVTLDGGSSNDTGLFEELNVSAIREVQVIAGGMEAEYGNVQGGVVNIVTKDGARAFGGRIEYKVTLPGNRTWELDAYDRERREYVSVDPTAGDVTSTVPWDTAAWQDETVTLPGRDGLLGTSDDTQERAHEAIDYGGLWGHRLEAMGNGPVSSVASWIIAGSSVRVPGGQPSASPYGFYTSQRTEAGLPATTDPFGFTNAPRNLRLNGKLTVRPTGTMSLKFGAVFAGAGVLQGGRSSGSPFFVEGETTSGKSLRRDGIYSFTFSHALSPRTYYLLQVADFATRIDTSDVPPSAIAPIRDADGRFLLYSRSHAYTLADRRRLQTKAELFHQLSKVHFVRAGVDLTRYSTWTQDVRTNGQALYSTQDIAAGAQSVSAFPQDVGYKYNNSAAGTWSGLTANGLPIGRGGSPYEPRQLSAYFSDKIEHQGTFMTLGVRFDAFWPEATIPALPGASSLPMFDTFGSYTAVRPGFDPIDDILNPDARYLPIAQADPMYQLSPRFGMAARVTEGLVLRTSYGTYYQIPPFTTSYDSRWSGAGVDTDRNGSIDDGEWMNQASGHGPLTRLAKAEKTLNLEFGMDWNFILDYTVGLTLYYKQSSEQQLNVAGSVDIFDPSSSANVPYLQGGVRAPDGFGDVRGVELAFLKNFRKHFGIRASYNWNQVAEEASNSESFRTLVPDSGFVASGGWWTEWRTLPDGTREPVLPDAAALQAWGRKANEELRRLLKSDAYSLEEEGPVPGFHSFTYSRFVGATSPQELPAADSTLASRLQGSRQQTGSILLIFSTPRTLGPTFKGFSPFGDWRGNLIYRMSTGREVEVSSEFGVGANRIINLPIQSRVDVGLSRTLFRKDEGSEWELFVEVVNLFNDRNLEPVPNAYVLQGDDWLRYGLPVWPASQIVPDPYMQKFAGEEDHIPLGLFRDNPRFTEIGFRFHW